MARNATADATFSAGFEFARRLPRDPELRSMLKRLNWTPGQHVVMALESEPVVDVMARISFHETDGRAFIAIPDPNESVGFLVLLVVVVTSAEIHVADPVPLGPGASIGMLCELLRPAGTYVPSEWSHALLFERASAYASP